MYNDELDQQKFLGQLNDVHHLIYNNQIYFFSEPIDFHQSISNTILNLDQDWKKINSDYVNNRITIIDNFLNLEYAERLQRFMLSTNLRHDIYVDYAAINFLNSANNFRYPNIWFPILASLTNDCINNMRLLQGTQFLRAWSFIYENFSNGVSIHADPASVNINFWVTPDHCLESHPGTNGLTIWPIQHPHDWPWEKYNRDNNEIVRFLNQHQVIPVSIDYKFNRAVIFDSSFFHQSQPVVTKPGYENRRINYTLLYK